MGFDIRNAGAFPGLNRRVPQPLPRLFPRRKTSIEGSGIAADLLFGASRSVPGFIDARPAPSGNSVAFFRISHAGPLSKVDGFLSRLMIQNFSSDIYYTSTGFSRGVSGVPSARISHKMIDFKGS